MKRLGLQSLPILFVFILILSACSVKDVTNPQTQVVSLELSKPTVQAAVEYLTFEESLQRCTDIISARFMGCHDYETYRELIFDVLDVAKGRTSVETIYVLEQHLISHVIDTDISYISGAYEYEKGSDYLLVLERNVSIYQEHDRYVQLSDIYIPLSNVSESLIYSQKLDEHMKDSTKLSSTDELISYVKEIAQHAESSVDYYGTSYCESHDIKTVVEASDYIFHVKIGELIAIGRYTDTETYHCSIQDYLYGDLSYLSSQDLDAGIFVVFPKGEVSPNEEYLVLLNKVDEYSLIFNLSSKISCIPMSEESTVSTIEYLINE